MASQLLQFMMLIGKLKRVKRTGWVLRNVPDAECVADHMYRMGVLAFLLGRDKEDGPNREKCIKMALVHDLAECIVGDITPHCGVSKEEKLCRERQAMIHLTSMLDKDTGSEILQLWEEYENQETSEAKAVKDLDRFDMILQAYEYETLLEKPLSLQEFFDSTKDSFQTPQVMKWTEELLTLRSSQRNST